MTLYEIKEEIRREAREEGLAEGREEGRDQERRLIAAAMKEHDIPVEVISETTGLSKEEIETL